MGGREIVTLDAISRYEDGDQRAAMLRTCLFLWPAIRRSRLLAVGGYDESFAVMQDWECFARLVFDGAPVAYVHEPLYRWRMTPGSRSSRDRVANVEAIERMLVKLLDGPSLRDSERARAQALLVQRRRWLARERARQAVENRSARARGLSLGLLAGRGFDGRRAPRRRDRVLAGAGAALPRAPRRAGRSGPRGARAERLSLGRRGERVVSARAPGVEELSVGGWRVSAPPRTGYAAGDAEPHGAPRLSVIITYFLGEQTIADAVRSVLAQTVPPHEIVICDDGSPDDLDAGLGELREHVRIVRKQNGGTGSALNAAAAAASGDYLVQLDVDDAFCPRRLEAVAAVLAARPDVDIVTGDALIEYGERVVASMGRLNPPALANGRETMLERNWIPWPAARRSLVIQHGGWDVRFKVFEDWDCWLRLVLAGARRRLRARAALPLATVARQPLVGQPRGPPARPGADDREGAARLGPDARPSARGPTLAASRAAAVAASRACPRRDP